jgi:hypothetical protein
MRILFVSPYIPSLIRVRPFNILRALVRRGNQVTLLALQPPGDEGEALDELRQMCDAVYTVPHSKGQTLVNGLLALPSDSRFRRPTPGRLLSINRRRHCWRNKRSMWRT